MEKIIRDAEENKIKFEKEEQQVEEYIDYLKMAREGGTDPKKYLSYKKAKPSKGLIEYQKMR